MITERMPYEYAEIRKINNQCVGIHAGGFPLEELENERFIFIELDSRLNTSLYFKKYYDWNGTKKWYLDAEMTQEWENT